MTAGRRKWGGGGCPSMESPLVNIIAWQWFVRGVWQWVKGRRLKDGDRRGKYGITIDIWSVGKLRLQLDSNIFCVALDGNIRWHYITTDWIGTETLPVVVVITKVESIPTAAVAATRCQYQGGLPPGREWVPYLPPPPPCEQIDRRLWKHYLPLRYVKMSLDEARITNQVIKDKFSEDSK